MLINFRFRLGRQSLLWGKMQYKSLLGQIGQRIERMNNDT